MSKIVAILLGIYRGQAPITWCRFELDRNENDMEKEIEFQKLTGCRQIKPIEWYEVEK